MFGISDFIGLIISAFIILPIVIFIREVGYFFVSWIFGVKNPRLTIGWGPSIWKAGMLDIRKYYHLYSWYSFDSLKRNSNTAYVFIYAAPILTNLILSFVINALIANGFLEDYKTFFNRFIFYSIYYVLFDAIPMITVNGRPNNGMIIYEMLRYGKRTDFNDEPFIPSTKSMDETYQEEMKVIKEKEKEREEIDK